MILHGYWRSGASYRVRIALNLKGISYDNAAHDLRKGEQKTPDYVALNPQGMVPALQDGDLVLTQSPAILEWLEETRLEPALLPKEANDRATVRAMAALIGCDIHPLNNLRVLKAIRSEFNADQAAVDAWAARWIAPGFDALEALVARHGRRLELRRRPDPGRLLFDSADVFGTALQHGPVALAASAGGRTDRPGPPRLRLGPPGRAA